MIFQIGSLKIWVFWSNSFMWLVPFVVSLICGLYLARAFTTSKAFSRSSLCRLWLLLCTLNKILLLWCHIPWKLQIFPNSKDGFPPYSSQSSPPGFILLVIFWPHFCVEALRFLLPWSFLFWFVFPVWNEINYFSSFLLWLFIHKRNVSAQICLHVHRFRFPGAFGQRQKTDCCFKV